MDRGRAAGVEVRLVWQGRAKPSLARQALARRRDDNLRKEARRQERVGARERQFDATEEGDERARLFAEGMADSGPRGPVVPFVEEDLHAFRLELENVGELSARQVAITIRCEHGEDMRVGPGDLLPITAPASSTSSGPFRARWPRVNQSVEEVTPAPGDVIDQIHPGERLDIKQLGLASWDPWVWALPAGMSVEHGAAVLQWKVFTENAIAREGTIDVAAPPARGRSRGPHHALGVAGTRTHALTSQRWWPSPRRASGHLAVAAGARRQVAAAGTAEACHQLTCTRARR
jgi:hypothetical protein